MSRVSIAEVRAAFELAAIAGKRFLAENEEYVLQEGSPIAGQAFRLNVRETPSYGLTAAKLTGFNGYIGWTKREALDKLNELAEAYSK
jgi:hypothetical protein